MIIFSAVFQISETTLSLINYFSLEHSTQEKQHVQFGPGHFFDGKNRNILTYLKELLDELLSNNNSIKRRK